MRTFCGGTGSAGCSFGIWAPETNTPAIIKFPFWRMAGEWKDAVYACVNLGQAFAPAELQAKSICINADIGSVLRQLLPAQ